jgi:hypothetical protein
LDTTALEYKKYSRRKKERKAWFWKLQRVSHKKIRNKKIKK